MEKLLLVCGLVIVSCQQEGQLESPNTQTSNNSEFFQSRRYPDRSDRYFKTNGENYDQADSFTRNNPVNVQNSENRDVARQGNSQLPWEGNRNENVQYQNSSIGSQDFRDKDPGQLFRDFAKQREEIENRPLSTTTLKPETTTIRRPGQQTTRNPFEDPNRYIVPQTHDSNGVRFVNGLPYRETANIKDRYGNRYDPRSHSIPGQYDPKNDPRFSDPNFQDPRNVAKYDTNLQSVPRDRYDSKYRYYERFPDRQRDKLNDPNYDPRWDSKEPHAPGVLGGWLPELQGECRAGCENLERDVTVNTNYGRVNGFYVYIYDGPRVPLYERPGRAHTDKVKAKVSVFLGIPYAMPPVGDARLMPPRPHRGWQSYDAVDWAPVCPQPIKYVGATKNSPIMEEDCLYLNVFTPTVQSNVAQLFPVIIYIHGGAFQRGSANEFPGHQLAANGQVVVVAINYRLGALGFLSTGDHHAPGNYGLLDMAMAIKWVFDNVNSFQGDREKITLLGPDAGAASAGILAVMPKTKHMVRRVISVSGSPFADWAVFNDKFRAMNTSRVFGERVGCTIDSSWGLVDCIKRGRSFHELSNIEFKPEIGTWPWAPVVQKNISVPEDAWNVDWNSDDFMAIPELISVMYENQQYHPKLQYMTGVSKDDASYMLYANKTIAPDYDVGWDFFDTMVRDHINQYNYTLNPVGIFNAIKYMYTYYPDPNNKTHIREEFVNFWSDYFFKAPQDALVKTLVRNGVDTYMYVQNTTVEALRLPWWRKITHNLEHYFLSGGPFMDSVFFPEHEQISREYWTEGDRNMSQFFIYAFANFSWYGNPTPKTILGVHWDAVSKGEIQKYLAVNTTENSTTLWNYRQKECAFWTEYLPSVIGYITPTYPPTTEFWWEPESPLQIAFWSMSSVCLFLLVLVVVCCLLWRNAKRMSKDRYYDAGSIASLKHYPGDFDHMGDNLKYGRENMEMSPAMSHSSMRTGKTLLDNQDGVSLRSIPGATIQPSPSTHSLRSLGLRPVAPPVPNHGPPSVISGMQIPSRGPSSMGRPQSIAGGQMQDLSTQALQKSLPPTPAVTPAMLHKGLQGLQGSQRGMPVTQTMTQSGFAVGPGEIPNGAGPFVNGGLHNTSDDSILTNQSSVVGSDPRGSRKVNMDQSLESIGGTKYPTQVQPMTQPRPHTKLVPGRMSQNSGQQQRLPKSPGPQTRQQAPPSRPDSRASGRQTRGIIPSTAV